MLDKWDVGKGGLENRYIYEAFEKMNLESNEEKINNFLKYESLLVEWNEKMNLTAITEHKDVVDKHFIDSLTGISYINDGDKVIDVGTGAGFPGLPLKIYNNNLELTLIDSLNKRIKFLDEVIKETNLSNVKTVHTRSEDFAKGDNLNNYDVAVSRAVANLKLLSNMCLPFVKVGGVFLAYKGQKALEELEEAKVEITRLGGKVIEVKDTGIDGRDHKIIVIEKVKETKDKKKKKKR